MYTAFKIIGKLKSIISKKTEKKISNSINVIANACITVRTTQENHKGLDNTVIYIYIYIYIYIIKSVAYSSQGSHTGQLDFCN